MTGPGWERTDWAEACYRQILGRPPESAEVVTHHATRHASPAATLAAFVGSEEFHEGQRRAAGLRRLAAQPAPPVPGALRVLLFGAYGNGNLGDAAQPEAVAGLLRAATDRPLDIRATSWLTTAGFPFPPDQLLGPDTILEPALLAGFDLLLLAGGGLFAPLHFPLLHPDWLAFLQASGLPFGLFGLGAASTLRDQAGQRALWDGLLAGAAWCSGRDAASLSVMPGADWLPDPVLVAGLRAGGGVPRPPLPGARPLCIVKRPAHRAEAEFLAAVACLGPGVDVAVLEPGQDAEVAAGLPGAGIARDMAELRAMCDAASVVVSARYHGCIAGLLAGVPCFGIGPGKSLALLTALGAAERFLPHAGDLPAILAAPPAPLPATAFAPLRDAADAALGRFGTLLNGLRRRRRDTSLG